MNTTILTVIIAIVAVGFIMVALSLTLILKGRHMQTEVGENDEMKKRGLKCATQQIMEEEAAITGKSCEDSGCSFGSCATCEEGKHEEDKTV